MRYHSPTNAIHYSPLREQYGYPLPSRSAIEVSVALSYLGPVARSVPMPLSVSCARSPKCTLSLSAPEVERREPDSGSVKRRQSAMHYD